MKHKLSKKRIRCLRYGEKEAQKIKNKFGKEIQGLEISGFQDPGASVFYSFVGKEERTFLFCSFGFSARSL
jgi:hypothetical protein